MGLPNHGRCSPEGFTTATATTGTAVAAVAGGRFGDSVAAHRRSIEIRLGLGLGLGLGFGIELGFGLGLGYPRSIEIRPRSLAP